jgi:hypothetical protein
MDAMRTEAEEIGKVLGRRATPERRKIVAQGLASKWEGSQVAALKALAAWGDRESVEAIRDYLAAAFERKTGWSVRGAAIRALVPLVGPEDAGWITALCDARSGAVERHELHALSARAESLKRQ